MHVCTYVGRYGCTHAFMYGYTNKCTVCIYMYAHTCENNLVRGQPSKPDLISAENTKNRTSGRRYRNVPPEPLVYNPHMGP